MWDLTSFAAGAFGLYLAQPLLSLVDSTIVARLAGVEQLAALVPGTAICDGSAYALSCVGVATTNLYASWRAKGQNLAVRRVMSDSLFISLVCGLALGSLIIMAAPQVLAAFGTDLAIAEHALRYVRIRALAMPAALLGTAATASCLGAQDARSPVLAVAISSGLNLMFDILLVPVLGVAGAAWATSLSQVCGAAFLLQVLKQRRQQLRACGMMPFGIPLRKADSLFTVPSRRILCKFATVALPVFVAVMAKVLMMNAQAVAVVLAGTYASAAHQLACNVMYLFTPAGDALSSTGQAFLPAAAQGRWHVDAQRRARRRLISKVATLGTGWGVANALVAVAMLLCGAQLCIGDAAVLGALVKVAPIMAFALLFNCAGLALEGILVSLGRGRWLAWAYWLNCAAFVSALRWGTSHGGGLIFVWLAMGGFQAVRIAECGLRIFGDLRQEGRPTTAPFSQASAARTLQAA